MKRVHGSLNAMVGGIESEDKVNANQQGNGERRIVGNRGDVHLFIVGTH